MAKPKRVRCWLDGGVRAELVIYPPRERGWEGPYLRLSLGVRAPTPAAKQKVEDLACRISERFPSPSAGDVSLNPRTIQVGEVKAGPGSGGDLDFVAVSCLADKVSKSVRHQRTWVRALKRCLQAVGVRFSRPSSKQSSYQSERS